MELFEYQREAVAAITAKVSQSYLGYEMGTGKSAIAIATAKERKAERVLVICPAVGKLVWKQELKRWWPEARVTVVGEHISEVRLRGPGVYLLPYSLLSQANGAVDYVKMLAELVETYPFDMTVIDEAHYLKNPKSNRTRAVLISLRKGLGWCLPMSGTPAPNHAGELFPILRALFPESIRKRDGNPMKQYEFENTYCDIQNRWFGGRSVRVIEGSKNIDVLKSKMSPFMLRKTKKQVLKDLPDMMFDTYPISAPDAPAWAEDWKSLPDDEFEALLAGAGQHIMAMRHELGVAKVTGSCEAITNLLESCTRKVLVFAIHHDVVDKLMLGLGQYRPVKVDGRDSEKDREKAIKAFLDDPGCRVFVGNVKAAGTSITLVGPNADVSDVFFVEADFSPGNNTQAASRIHRIGQKDAVQVWFLTAHGTYDDRLGDILARKTRDFQQLFGVN